MDFKLHVNHIAFFLNGALRATSGQKIPANKAKSQCIAKQSRDNEEDPSEKEGEFASAKQFSCGDSSGKQANDNRGQRRPTTQPKQNQAEHCAKQDHTQHACSTDHPADSNQPKDLDTCNSK